MSSMTMSHTRSVEAKARCYLNQSEWNSEELILTPLEPEYYMLTLIEPETAKMIMLKVRIERIDGKYVVETTAIVNTGFIGAELEVVVPQPLADELRVHEIARPDACDKITADGREIRVRVGHLLRSRPSPPHLVSPAPSGFILHRRGSQGRPRLPRTRV